VGGFYDPLLLQMDMMVDKQFLKPINRDLVLSDENPARLVSLMEQFDSKPDDVWFRDRNLI
jgi:hypothetical protein